MADKPKLEPNPSPSPAPVKVPWHKRLVGAIGEAIGHYIKELVECLKWRLQAWLLGELNTRLNVLECHDCALFARVSNIEDTPRQAEVEALARITALENLLGINLGGVATAFVRVHERIDALEQAPAKAAMEAAVAVSATAKTAAKRKPAKR